MYTGELSPRDRAGPIGGVILVHLALGAMLLGLAGRIVPAAVQQSLKTFDVRDLPPPQVPPPVRKAKRAAAKPAAAPPNRESEATPIVAPTPRIVIQTLNPIVAAPVASVGSASTQGAAAIVGPGTGAGGIGNGFGSGGSGAGGGDDGTGTHPHPLFRPPDPRIYPRQLIEDLPRGARVFILFSVQIDGRITDCSVRQSSGDPAVDAAVCQVAEQRFRYDPARRGDGTPYVAKAAYMQVF
ncbi:MAG: energy transducer TonB [Sphingomicrobium sp.]|nr:energy transducer TonB [Sphingomonadales bacterium]